MDKKKIAKDLKSKADRERFNHIEKIPVSPLVTQNIPDRLRRTPFELKSPDERNPKWVSDPDDLIAARKAAKKAQRDNKPTE